MTVIKQFGKLATPALSFGENDSDINNTNRGSSEGYGFNLASENSATWGGKAPFLQTDFWGEEPTIKPNAGYSFGCYHKAELKYPRVSAAGDITMRSQYETIRNQTRIGFCFSFYVPTGGIVPQYIRKQVFQRYGGDGSPGFAMYLDYRDGDKDFLAVRFYKTGLSTDLIYCPIIRIEFNTWYHVIGFCDFRDDINGRMTIWLDRKIARIFPRIGSGEGVAVYSRIPVDQNGTNNYSTNSSLGQFVSGNVTEDGFTQTLFDWKGITVKPTNSPSFGQWNWGLYPSRSSRYLNRDTIIANLVDFPATKTWEECVLVNPNDPNGADYEEPVYRTQEYYSNFTLAIWGEGQTDEDVFRELHPEGLAPLEFPVGESAWPNGFTRNPTASEFNLTVQSSNTTFGTVSRSLSNPVTAGATDILTATPIGTGVFQGWYLGTVSFANLITTDNPYSRVVNSDETIIGHFIDGTPIPPEQPRKKWAKKRPVL